MCVLNPDTEIEGSYSSTTRFRFGIGDVCCPRQGGQSFIPEVEHKVRAFREAIDKPGDFRR